MTRTRKLMSASIATVLLLSVLLNIVVYAQAPDVPMTVYGVVYVDTVPAPAGLNVYAKEGTTIIDQCLTIATGQYALSLLGPDEGTSIDLWVESENVLTLTLLYMNITVQDLIYTGTPANVAPIAVTNGPYTADIGIYISFDGSGSSDSDGTIVNHAWNLGDGTTANVESFTNSYTAAGNYTVTLTVTDNDDATHTATTYALITDPGTPPTNVAPVADADGPYSDYVGEAISFDGSGSTDSDGTIASYAWTFGDTGTATTESPSHTYTAPRICSNPRLG